MKERYSAEGYRIVSEIDHCSFWEKDSIPCYGNCARDCFFCRYADFRKEQFMERASGGAKEEPLYSVCRNEKNRKQRENSVI